MNKHQSVATLGRDSLSELHQYLDANQSRHARRALPERPDGDGGEANAPADHGLEQIYVAFEQLRRWAFPNDRPDWSTLREIALHPEHAPELAPAPQGKALPAGPGWWTFSGPLDLGRGSTDVSGRVNAVAIDPSNAGTIYIGAAGGGVWKTTDNGMTWTPLANGWTFEAVSSIAIDPRSPATIYVGTGDFPNWSNQSFGLMKSVDGGATFTPLAVAEMGDCSISSIAIDPENPSIVTITGGRGRQRYGQVWRSLDGGQQWNAVVTEGAEWSDLAIGPQDGSGTRLYYAVGWNSTGGIMYRSSDRGATWRKLTVPWGPGQFGISVTPSATAPRGVYVLAGKDKKVLASSSGGDDWSDITGNLSQNAWDWDQVWYDWCLRSNALNGVDVLLLGLKHLFRWEAAGKSWTTVPSGHDDQHTLLVDPTNPLRTLLGNDGGVWSLISNPTTQAYTASSLNAKLGITQIYKAGFTPRSRRFMLEGAQDNGLGFATGDLAHWGHLGFSSGDEVAAVILPTNRNVQYAAQGVGYYGLFRTTDAWASYKNFTPSPQGDLVNSFSTILVSDMQGSGVYWGTDYLWYWDEGVQTWSSHLGGQRLAGGKQDSVRAIGVAPSDRQRVCTGSSDGQVWLGQGPAWTWIQNNGGQVPLPWRSISGISFHPQDPNDLLVTIDGMGSGHVWRCVDVTNGDRTWVDISGQGSGRLPDVPVNAVARHPLDPENRLFVATDVGVFGTEDGGANWFDLTLPYGLPRVPVKDLAIVGNQLHAVTYGRGIWTARLEFTDVAPVATSVGDTIFVFAKGISGHVYSCQAKFGQAFSEWREIAGYRLTDAAPGVTSVGDAVFVFIKGLDGRIYLNQAAANADPDTFVNSFSGWFEVQGDGRTDVGPTAAAIGDHVFVFVKGLDQRIYVNQADYGHAFGNRWFEVQGGGRTDAAPAAAVIEQTVFVFVKGLDGRIYLNQADLGNAFGSSWFELQGDGRTDVAPSAASIGQSVCCFVTGLDGRIYLNQAEYRHAFSGWFEVQGNGITDVAVGAGTVLKSLFAFVKGLDGMPAVNQAEFGHAFSGWFAMNGDSP